ncbi:serine protease SSP1-like [Battus philenor]|uniref:serine protease SSP1-like n=1 Tax=Battus philenor TaxID=42288 RepID=UPI0035CFE93A
MLVFLVLLSCECYAFKSPLRIYGGRDASPGEYPYVVRLEVLRVTNFTNNTVIAKHHHLCTASALTATWALTAAHCIAHLNRIFFGKPYTMEKLIIRYGHVQSSTWANNTFCDVISIVPHPFYYYSFVNFGSVKSKTGIKNDIGLVKTTPMHLKSYVKLSAVDYILMYGQEAVVAGFGITTKKLPGGKIITEDTLKLRKPLQVLTVMITKCPEGTLLAPSFCLAPRCGHTVTTCSGDSGGPLIHPSGVTGVLSISFRSGSCGKKAPKNVGRLAGGMTPVSPYIEWIYSYVKT